MALKYFAAIEKRILSRERREVWGIGRSKETALKDGIKQAGIYCSIMNPRKEPNLCVVEVTKDLYDYVQVLDGLPRRYIKRGRVLDLSPYHKRELNELREWARQNKANRGWERLC